MLELDSSNMMRVFFGAQAKLSWLFKATLGLPKKGGKTLPPLNSFFSFFYYAREPEPMSYMGWLGLGSILPSLESGRLEFFPD